MSVFLVAKDAGRLANLFVLNRRVEPTEPYRFFQRRWLNRGLLALQIVFGFFLIGYSFYQNIQQAKTYGAYAPKPPLYGIWMVDEFAVDGQVRPPLLTDAARWQRVIIPSKAGLTIQPISGALLHKSNRGYTLSVKHQPLFRLCNCQAFPTASFDSAPHI